MYLRHCLAKRLYHVLRFRYFIDFRCGIAIFADIFCGITVFVVIFCGIAVFGTPQCPPLDGRELNKAFILLFAQAWSLSTFGRTKKLWNCKHFKKPTKEWAFRYLQRIASSLVIATRLSRQSCKLTRKIFADFDVLFFFFQQVTWSKKQGTQ